jgi:hypothetical protein
MIGLVYVPPMLPVEGEEGRGRDGSDRCWIRRMFLLRGAPQSKLLSWRGPVGREHQQGALEGTTCSCESSLAMSTTLMF